MAAKLAKTSPRPQKNDDFFGIKALIKAIENSALSEGKKLAYLYMIFQGSFSESHFIGLKEDMVAAGEKLEQKIINLEKEQVSTNAQIATLEQEINELTPAAVKELKENLDKYVAAVAQETEAERAGKKGKAITKIKTKLSKE